MRRARLIVVLVAVAVMQSASVARADLAITGGHATANSSNNATAGDFNVVSNSDGQSVPVSGPFTFTRDTGPATAHAASSFGTADSSSTSSLDAALTASSALTHINFTASGSATAMAHVNSPPALQFDAFGSAHDEVQVDFTVTTAVPYTLAGSIGSLPTGTGSGNNLGTATLRHQDPGNTSIVAVILAGSSKTLSGTLQPGKYDFFAELTVSSAVSGNDMDASQTHSNDAGVDLNLGGGNRCAQGEVPEVKVGFADAEGCFKEQKDSQGHPTGVFDTTQDAYVGGFLFTPKPGGGLRLRNNIGSPRLEEIRSGVDLVVGTNAVPFPAEVLPVGFAQADIGNGNASALKVFGDGVMKGFGFKSFPLSAGLKVKWSSDGKSSTITGDVAIDDLWKALGKTTTPPAASGSPVSPGASPGAGGVAFGGASGSVGWTATNGFGFDLTSVKVKGSRLGLLVEPGDQLVGIDAYSLSYSVQAGRAILDGSAAISIPRSSSSAAGSKPLVLGGRLKFVDASFGGAGLSIDGLNKPLGDTGIFFQGVQGNLDVSPDVGFTLGGKFTLLPPVNNESIADGTVELRGFALAAGCTSAPKPIEVHTNITSSAFENHGFGKITADGSNCMYFDKFGLESNMAWDIRVDAGGIKGVAQATGNVRGFIASAGMNLEGTANVILPIVPGMLGGTLLVSSTGWGACVNLAFFSGGIGHAWADSTAPQTFQGCDLGPWRVTVPRLEPAAAAVSAKTISLPAGRPLEGFLARGANGPPAVELDGPHHERFTPPRDGHLVKRAAVVIATSKPERAVFFIVHKPSAGRWRIVNLDSSHPSTGVATSAGLPDPRLRARVVGAHSRRQLRYSLRPRPGLKAQFVETAGGLIKPLDGARSARVGVIRFKPLIVHAKRHEIRALVIQDGIPVSDRVVARFSVKPPVRPPKVKRLTAKREGTRLNIQFKPAPGATLYLITIADGTGHTLRTFTVKPRLSVRGVPPHSRLTVSVTPDNALDEPGRTSKVRIG